MKTLQDYLVNEKLSDSEKIINIIKKESGIDNSEHIFLLFKDLINSLETEMDHKEWEEFVERLYSFLKDV